MEYSSMLFIPEKAPFDLFSYERKHGVKLYVKRVFIMDNCKELLPDYLRFVRGIVDSEDLPLNVSREILQKNPIIDRIAIVAKILGKLKEMAERTGNLQILLERIRTSYQRRPSYRLRKQR